MDKAFEFRIKTLSTWKKVKNVFSKNKAVFEKSYWFKEYVNQEEY